MILSDVAAERAVLAGVCRYGSEAFFDIADIVNEQTFTVDSNSVIFSCISRIFKEESTPKIDVASILSSAKDLGLESFFSNRNELEHLSSVIKYPVVLPNVRKFAAKIRKLQIAQMMYNQLGETRDKYLHIRGDESISHILGLAEESIFDFTSLLSDDDDSPKKVFEDIENYLEEKAENKVDQVGISTGFVKYDFSIGGGLRKGTVNVIGARPKALGENEVVYTKNGKKKVQDVIVGDEIIHPFDGVTKVTEVYEFHNEDLYRITFRDGDTILACKDHRWEVYKRYPYNKFSNKICETKTTQELISDLRIGKKQEYKWDIRLPNPVEFENQNINIDPYVVGVLLGDGSIKKDCRYHTMDDEIHEYLSKYFTSLGYDVKIESKRSKATTYRVNGFQNTLRKDKLFGLNCYNKHIPSAYKYASIKDRISLLQGLCDTDGDCTVDPRSNQSRTRFTSVSYDLCLDFKEVVHSLGGLCSVKTQHTICNGKKFKSYRCEVRLPEGIIPFRLSRKRNKFTERKIGELKRTISKIEKVKSGSAYCFKVDAEDELFVTTNFLITKNTGKTLMAMNVGIDIAKRGIPVLDLDTEMRIEDHKDRGAAMLSFSDSVGKSTINEIETGQFANSNIRKKKLIETTGKHKNIPYYHKNIGGKAFEDQLSIMRRWLAKVVGLNDRGKANDCVIIYDYLKLMDSSGMKNADLKEYQMLGFMMTSLHNFALRYDIPVFAFVQLNRDGITKESTDTASGSDRIIWLCSNFTIYKSKSDEEIAKDGEEYGNRKLVPVIARHGEGLEHNDYINIIMKGKYAKLIEGPTALELEEGGDYVTDEDGEEDVAF